MKKAEKHVALTDLTNHYKTDYRLEIGSTIRNLVIINREIRIANRANWKRRYKYYKYQCNVCGYIGWKIEHNVINHRNGCACCAGYVVKEGFNDIPTTASWMIKFFQGGYDEAKQYTRCSTTRIKPICPDCGQIKEKPIPIGRIYYKRSIGCTCGDGYSFYEKYMMSFLDQSKIRYEPQYDPDWLKGYKDSKRPKRFDYLLPDNNMIIETDGGLNHDRTKPNPYGIEYDFDVDAWKDEQAVKHGLKVIRVDARDKSPDEFRDSIINTLTMFDTDSIDWELCEKKGYSNRVKEVCQYYERNKQFDIKTIANHFCIGKMTVYDYLHKGTKLGWCNYDSRKGYAKTGERLSKKTEVYKDGMILGVYNSTKELSRNSINDFGVYLLDSSISAVARGKYKHHKGYTFKYA